ncbi:LysE family transporter [Sneathiella chungangensis]|uniref:LysE family transporter n=1 Tax=Sneathiella chungangensis TaxID=1418234 RepID=A0A845MGN5_9PROT|nr:LysE family translocator [Sneathiella chungangensis]MZR22590.1 LysE family transporter [Sneathiella chungangensis]
MSFEIWISFFIASAALLAVPGPTVMIVISYALGQGRSTAWATVPGVALGDFTAMTASLLGAGAVLAASATLFTVLKIAGAVYLVWLGIKLWRADGGMGTVQTTEKQSRLSIFRTSYIVTALNPKSIVFFVAFVPQFVNVHEPIFVQFAILEATFLVLAAINVAIWASLVGNLRERFKNPRTLKIVNRIGASFLIGAGLLTALVRRTA